MRNDRKIDVSFSAKAADYISRFMKAVDRNRAKRKFNPNYHLVDRRDFHGQNDGQSDEVRSKYRCLRD
jgi:hypothetical protein